VRNQQQRILLRARDHPAPDLEERRLESEGSAKFLPRIHLPDIERRSRPLDRESQAFEYAHDRCFPTTEVGGTLWALGRYGELVRDAGDRFGVILSSIKKQEILSRPDGFTGLEGGSTILHPSSCGKRQIMPAWTL
jgi:hypothetical protein